LDEKIKHGMKKQIPNIFTLLNLLFGCMAIVNTMQQGLMIEYNAEGAQFLDVPVKMYWSSFFIAMAAVIDFFDGFVARWLNATSEMGKQLDSLSDLVSFGVAPSLIMYQFLRLAFAGSDFGIEMPVMLLNPAFLLALSAAYRLARFNLGATDAKGFEGMPSPAAGLLIASFPLIYWQNNAPSWLFNPWMLYVSILVVSWLMISKMKLFSLKFSKGKNPFLLPFLILMMVAIVSALFLQWLAVPITFIGYILLSLLFKKKLS